MEWVVNDARRLSTDSNIWKYRASGGTGGSESSNDHITRYVRRIVKLGIHYGPGLYAINVHYQRWDDDTEYSYRLGTSQENEVKEEINFDQDDYITKVRGAISNFKGAKAIRSIEIETKLNNYGPYGDEEHHEGSEEYEFNANGGIIIGFHGRSGSFIDAIGVYVKDEWLINNIRQLSPTVQKIGPCGCTRGGERNMDHEICNIDRIVKLGIRHGSATDAIKIYFQRFDGTGGTYCFGGEGGGETEVNFRPDEYIMLVRGKIGYVPVVIRGNYRYPSVKAVRSIEIITNIRNYGPYGVDEGTSFEFQADGGQIIGFHGRAVPWVYSIGVYVRGGRTVGSTVAAGDDMNTSNMRGRNVMTRSFPMSVALFGERAAHNDNTTSRENTTEENATNTTTVISAKGGRSDGGTANVTINNNFYGGSPHSS